MHARLRGRGGSLRRPASSSGPDGGGNRRAPVVRARGRLARLDTSPGGATPVVGRAIREVPIAEHPRERLALRGAGGLTSAELIRPVWGSRTRRRAAAD